MSSQGSFERGTESRRKNSRSSDSKEDIAALLDRQQSLRATRKASMASLGHRFSSIVSISSQVAATVASLSVSEAPCTSQIGSFDIEPNDVADKLVSEIIASASIR